MKRIILISLCLLLLQTLNLAPNSMPASLAKLSGMPVVNSSTLDHGGQIETKYDGFNHETIVTLKKMRVTCGGANGLQSALTQTCVSMVASLHCPGKQLDYVRYAKLQFVFESKDWDQRHPLDQRELFLVADGKQLQLGRMVLAKNNVEYDRGIEVMKEVLEVSVPYKVFDMIASSNTVEVKVGKSRFGLQEKNLEALRDMNIRVRL
ncbi:MAG TPA: hypothetical protein VFD48_10340 [Pyrinomonadaceae bacterium]|nr:hypothetical protein [Pyrinomonadaceae bacterium]